MIEIRRITAKEIPQFQTVLYQIMDDLAQFYNVEAIQAEKDLLTEEKIREYYAAADHYLLLGVFDNNEMIGARFAYIRDEEVALELSGLRADQRGKGIGTQLHEATFELIRKEYPHIQRIVCDTRITNDRGIGILRSLGFEITGTTVFHDQPYFLWKIDAPFPQLPHKER